MKKFIIAIDGGGTKTVGVLADMHGEILNYKVGGPSNPNDVGEKQAANTIGKIIRELADAEEGWIDSVYAGISGAIGNEAVLRRAVSEACPDAKSRWRAIFIICLLCSAATPHAMPRLLSAEQAESALHARTVCFTALAAGDIFLIPSAVLIPSDVTDLKPHCATTTAEARKPSFTRAQKPISVASPSTP